MQNFIFLTADDRAALLSLLAAVAVVLALAVVLWPYLGRDSKAERLKLIRAERERIRSRERARLIEETAATLRQAPQKMLLGIVSRMRGRPDGDDRAQFAETARLLRRAGFQKPGAVAIYVSMQVVLPLLALAGSAAYLYVLIPEPPPAITQVAVLVGGAASAHFLPRIYVHNQLNKRRVEILKSWPDALDLMLICVESGMTIETALARVSDEMAGQCADLSEELNLTVAELSYLQDRGQAFRNLGDRTALHSVRSVVSSLMQSEKYGTSLSASLRVISAEQREARLTEAEKKAAALPPKLTVPMIFFFLPVLFVVILMPAAIKLMGMQ